MTSDPLADAPVRQRHVDAPPEAVWRILADGWLYVCWVVGAARIRAVDPQWPAQGSTIAHSVGLWPALIDDTTGVLEVDPGRRLVLEGAAWPTGEAKINIGIEPEAGGCRVSITEDVATGPGRFLPPRLRHAWIAHRNDECLHRLAMLAERRATGET